VSYQIDLVVLTTGQKKADYTSGLIIKDILMSETKDRKFTHDEVVEVAGEYLKCKKTGKWVSESDVENYETEMLNIEIQQYYEREQDKYY
tara:strand:- start:164 stop:433 length:270 start_codon:yes stop_codon:yes gene_type:complete